MLTGSKRTLRLCRLITLPSAVPRSIGSFLTTFECFVAARTCKNNEGLKALLTSIEKIQLVEDEILPRFVSVIDPSLISSIGCSVKVLEVTLYNEAVGALVQLLPRLVSLQQFHFFLGTREMRLFKQVFPSIPQRVRCLTLDELDAEGLRFLGEAAAAGCLPVLEKLALTSLEVETVEDMIGLKLALMAPSLGKNLKTLFLDFPSSFADSDEEEDDAWPLLEFVLNAEDQTTGILSRLETLVLRSFTGWGMLAGYLLPGDRLPRLQEVYSPDETDWEHLESDCVAWYEIDSQTCRSWFELLYRRPLQTFDRRIPSDGNYRLWNPKSEKKKILELFRCLSNRALKPKCISAIKEVDLATHIMQHVCSDTFEALAGAMRLGNLRFLESLALGATTTCSSESLASLGKALDRAFLPCLTSFSFRMPETYHGNLGHVELEELSLLLKSLFGSIPTEGLDNLQKVEFQMPSPWHRDPTGCGIGILLDALAEVRPKCFHHLPEVCLSEIFAKNIERVALVFEAGIFPSVERLKISGGELYDEDLDYGMMPRLLRGLSDYTNIKELHINVLDGYEATRQFAQFLLESMLNLLVLPTPPALFPSLQILKILTICASVKPGSNYFEPLLLSIKAVRPPNLKTIISVEKRV